MKISLQNKVILFGKPEKQVRPPLECEKNTGYKESKI